MNDKDEHSKWHALLQPIRDLEKNWDIDIAGELTDYLEELSQITFEVDGICNLDFAEAALVVHSSSCTYGKKVEHLLKLTVSALENVRQQHQKKNAGKRRKIHDEDHARQLGIADVLLSVMDGNLQQCDENALPQLRAPESQPALLHDVLMAESCPVVAHVVAAGKPQHVGDSLASGPSDAPTFNMIRCHGHASGAFFLLKEDGDGFDAHMRPVHKFSEHPTDTGNPTTQPFDNHAVNAFGSPVDHLDPLLPDATVLSAHPEPRQSTFASGGADLAAPDVEQHELPVSTLPNNTDDQDGTAADHDTLLACTNAIEDEAIDDMYDDDGDADTDDGGWLVLDPHDASQNHDKPFRRNQPCAPKLKCELKQFTWQPFILPELQTAAKERFQLLLPGCIPAKATSHGAVGKSAVPAEPIAAQRPAPALDAFGLAEDENMPMCDQRMLAEHAGQHCMEDNDCGVEDYAYDDTGDDHADRDWHGLNNDAAIEPADQAGNQALPRAALTYEELVAQYSQAVAAASHIAMSHTLESKKVRNWKVTIRQAMHEQLDRPDFDVHKTGEQLVRQAGFLAETKIDQLCFGDILRCEHKYEVARCFSAFLQQVNNNAVDLIRGDTPADPFFVKVCR